MYRFFPLSCLIGLLLLLVATALATVDLPKAAIAAPAPAPAPAPAVRRRRQPQQSAGSACSDEGQWNCMTSSWQRCAAGRWSVVVPCAKGTTCYPAGLTRDLRIQHDGSVNGNGGQTTTTSLASQSWASRIGILGMVLVWCVS